MTEMNRPIVESYWVVPGQLLAGEYPAYFDEELTRKRLAALIKAGFDTFIDLTLLNENVPYVGLLVEAAQAQGVDATYWRFPIGDFGLPTLEQMNSVLNALEERLRTGHKVYLHCWGGVGRTGTTVGCYLVRQGKTGVEALDQLAAWWKHVPKSRQYPHSPETDEQMNFILHWAEHDRKR